MDARSNGGTQRISRQRQAFVCLLHLLIAWLHDWKKALHILRPGTTAIETLCEPVGVRVGVSGCGQLYIIDSCFHPEAVCSLGKAVARGSCACWCRPGMQFV